LPDWSTTVAVHVVEDATFTVEGSHVSVVVLDRVETETLVDPWLPRWLLSPPYVAVIVEVPTALGQYLPVHDPELSSVHDPASNVPPPELANVTVPVGVTPVPDPVSATTTVQLAGLATCTELGLQLTVVDVLLKCDDGPVPDVAASAGTATTISAAVVAQPMVRRM
jgi:hypothetical protein